MLLRIDHINKQFGAVSAIRDLSFSISENEVLGITGPDGSGKTTLLNLIMGVYSDRKGDISFAGQSVNWLSTEEIARLGIGRTFQVPQPFYEMTVLENLMLGAMHGVGHHSIEAAKEFSMGILDRVGMKERAEARAGKLGLHDLKRLELAMALCLKPRLLLVDEIFTGLAEEEKAQIKEVLLGLKKEGLSMLIMEHTPGPIFEILDRVIVLNFGELVAEGAPDEIMRSPRIREIYLGKEDSVGTVGVPAEEKIPDIEPAKLLSVKDVSAGHGEHKVLSGVSLDVFKGEIVALAGAKGSGKTTLVNVINMSLPLMEGDILFKEESILQKSPHEIAELGITQCVEGRRLFPGLTVRENLEIGAYCRRARAKWRSTMERVFDLFPVLASHRDRIAGSLSGGEQRMTAIGCAMMGLPEFIMFDELSLGLAPLIIEKLYEAITEINRQGITILLADQSARQILEIANRGYIIEKGRIIISGNTRELKQKEYIKNISFGA